MIELIGCARRSYALNVALNSHLLSLEATDVPGLMEKIKQDVLNRIVGLQLLYAEITRTMHLLNYLHG